ncbi:MAG: ABC transporter permease [Bacteroidales bacterium]|nr:ABC transporter permease [Bacteroidales bacterium]
MDASLFIARRLRFKGSIAMTCIAISFLVMIVAVAVSSGFRHEIRNGLSAVTGDIRITPPDRNVMDEGRPIESDPAYLPYIEGVDVVEKVVPVIYRAGIVRSEGNIHGVLFKGMPAGELSFSTDSVSLGVSIPRRLARIAGLEPGDRLPSYFIGNDVKARQFNVVSVYDSMIETDETLIVYASLNDLQRLNGWSEGQVSSLEVILDAGSKDEKAIRNAAEEVGSLINAYSSEDEASVIALSSVSEYPQLFGWLDMIDFNVFFILLLMTIVAGFNMISGLLIMLFENISTIGLLKSLGMTDRAIAKVFLSSSAVLTAKGMAVGNAIAILFCIVQSLTHILKLDPENYFVSFVPVHLDLAHVLAADVAAFAAIMLLLLIPCLFISKVDPAETVRVR